MNFAASEPANKQSPKAMRVDIFPPYVRIEVHASVPPKFPILHGKVGPCQMSSRFNAAQPILFGHSDIVTQVSPFLSA